MAKINAKREAQIMEEAARRAAEEANTAALIRKSQETIVPKNEADWHATSSFSFSPFGRK